jgi:hypothetical protein
VFLLLETLFAASLRYQVLIGRKTNAALTELLRKPMQEGSRHTSLSFLTLFDPALIDAWKAHPSPSDLQVMTQVAECTADNDSANMVACALEVEQGIAEILNDMAADILHAELREHLKRFGHLAIDNL